ncbi:MAG: cell surface protein SprA, partial [Paramuribaculum sp.]|nr:cell surface protein SprA [Paramuribaculum sp.]
VMRSGVRKNASSTKGGTVWVNELKVTDFESDGGWAAKVNANLGLSDIATLNFGTHIETSGFGGVDQSLNTRRMDDYTQINFAVQGDVGRFAPSSVKLNAPVYYSVMKERNRPKYNPLDKDVLLKDALEDAGSARARDSIESYAIQRSTVTSFSVTGFNFGVKSKNPKPWDPANFTVNFSFNRQSKSDPTTEYENADDYRGSFQYSYSPRVKGLRPFGKIGSSSKNLKYLKEWELNWLPNSISFLTTMSRYYYEQQTRSEIDNGFTLPVQVSKNFLWDRQLNLSWAITKTLNVNFTSNTSARIDEPMGAVNKKLFPDKYKEWKDTVMQSILSLGTPWGYNQTFSASYKAPFNRIPVIDFLNGSVSYNSSYRWARGATVDGVNMGNTIANQGAWSADGSLNFENIYNKIPWFKKVGERFSSAPQRPGAKNTLERSRRFIRAYPLSEDTTVTVTHNLKTKKVNVTVTDAVSGRKMNVRTRVIDENNVELLTKGTSNVNVTVTEIRKEHKGFWSEAAQFATRFVMSPRNASVKWRRTRSLSLPLFRPDIGNAFGQTRDYGPMSPGLDFAFGFTGEGYITRAKERGWLMLDDGQTSPAIFSRTNEVTIELSLEPIRGLRISLNTNRTDNRSSSVQFMYNNIPTSLSGSYTKTHCAIATGLRSGKAENGYANAAFTDFLNAIPVIAERVNAQYVGKNYPDGGFMAGHTLAGQPYSREVCGPSVTGCDVLIPAFIAAYTGTSPSKQYLTPFPSLAQALPNWRISYDGIGRIPALQNIFKTIVLNHAYQCSYSVGSYSSYLNWISVDGSDIGFTLNELTGQPMPSSPYNISSVTIAERFAPLIGASATMNNDLTINAEWRNTRTLTLNTSAGQVVESTTTGITAGVGYKIVGFNTVLKMKGSQQGISNDLTINGDFSYQPNQALIRRIETAYT